MRRRICISSDGSGLEDITDHPSRYNIDEDLPFATLYDDPIWGAYLAAREAFKELELAVIGHFHGGEPYDDIERLAAMESRTLLDDHEIASTIKIAKLTEISARVLEHAEDLYGNGEAPR